MQETLSTWLANPLLRRAATAAVGLLLVVVIARFANRSLARFVADVDVRYRARKIVTFLGYLLAALVVAAAFSDSLGALGVTVGVMGAGVAFALQEVIVSVAGWVTIAFGNVYRVGDRVQLAGIRGDVIDIAVLRTTLMECGEWVKGDLYDGRIVRVANSFVFKEPVFNYSADFPFLWDEMTVPVRHGADPEFVRDTIHRVLLSEVEAYTAEAEDAWRRMVRRYRIEDASVEPMVTMTFDENWMTFTARYIVDYRKRRGTKDKLSRKILAAFAESGGRLQVAGATLEVSAGSSLSVTLNRQRESHTQ